jgi:uncharacterized membrane protein (DUF4010 family)
MSEPPAEVLRLLVAILIGFLIGLDRERAEVRKHHRLFAGVRTFSLIALAGAVPALMLERWGAVPLVASFVAVAGVTIVAYARSTASGAIGSTTEVAALVTFLLGAMSGAGQPLLAGGAAIVVAVLLTAKPTLKRFSRALTEPEMDAVLELGVISCIVLPLLPRHGYGPWHIWNPFEIWLVVVVVSGLSFAGFIAMRLFGERRGLLVAGVVGSVVSSTGVTVAMAQRSRTDPALARTAATAAILASAVMGVRVLLLVSAYGPAVLLRLAPAVLAMSLVSLAVAALLARRRADGASPTAPAGSPLPTTLSNPFSLRAALSFGLLYAGVLLLVPAARLWLGSAGTFTAAVGSALLDVDAMTIAFARDAPAAGPWREAATAIAIGVTTNTLVKAAIVAVLARGSFRRWVIIGLLLPALACVGTAAALYYGAP